MMQFRERQIDQYLWDDELTARKMLFISGPRQVGKTTWLKAMLASGRAGSYANWDAPAIRRRYQDDPYFFLHEKRCSGPWLILFDEIHKRRNWKDILKGMSDTLAPECRVVVSGSARLDLFRRSGDSLIGRYFHFSMLPASVAEVTGARLERLWLCSADDWLSPAASLRRRILDGRPSSGDREAYEALLRFGGFPEPLTRGSERFLRRWLRDYLTLLLTEDLRDLTRIREVDVAERLVTLLPERVGSPLSLNALAGDLSVAHATVANHLAQLERLWLLFTVRPWSGRLNRTLRKEAKRYFIDWAHLPAEGLRFENMVAAALQRACTVWSDLGHGTAELRFVRTTDGAEVDFLVVLDGRPALLIEAKTSHTTVERTARNLAERIGAPLIQVVALPGILRDGGPGELVVSVERLLGVLP